MIVVSDEDTADGDLAEGADDGCACRCGQLDATPEHPTVIGARGHDFFWDRTADSLHGGPPHWQRPTIIPPSESHYSEQRKHHIGRWDQQRSQTTSQTQRGGGLEARNNGLFQRPVQVAVGSAGQRFLQRGGRAGGRRNNPSFQDLIASGKLTSEWWWLSMTSGKAARAWCVPDQLHRHCAAPPVRVR